MEAGGGLRRPADVAALLELADDALLGTAAIEDPAFLRAAPHRRIPAGSPSASTCATACRRSTAGCEPATRIVVELARRLLDDGASRLIVTDTSRDGTLAGPNLELLSQLRAAVPGATWWPPAASARSTTCARCSEIGCDGAVVGLALLTGAIDPAEAMAVLS